MPIKRWWIERIVKELNRGKNNDGGDGGGAASRALHANSPEARHLQGMARQQTPSRLRRFS